MILVNLVEPLSYMSDKFLAIVENCWMRKDALQVLSGCGTIIKNEN